MQLLALAGSIFLVVYSVAAQSAESVGPCAKAKQDAGQSMPGRYIPQCTEAGYFQPIQCHGSTGRCWCVVPDDGKVVEGSSVMHKQPDCSLCYLQRAQFLRPAGFVGGFIPECTNDGLFAPTQHWGSTGHAWCVDQYTGEEIKGTRTRPGDQRVVDCEKKERVEEQVTGPCTKARLDVGQAMPGRYIPQCTEAGYFEPVQCHGSTGRCWCVAPDDGKVVEGSSVMRKQPDCPICHIQRAQLLRPAGLVGNFVPVCTDDGLFASTQHWGSIGHSWCVNKYTGEEIEGSRTRPGDQRVVDCEKEARFAGLKMQGALKNQGPCYAKIVEERGRSGTPGFFTPRCTQNGFYRTEQRHGSTGFSWCVNPLSGDEIAETRRGPGQEKVACGACFKEIEEKLTRSQLVGNHFAQCNERNGDYSPEQFSEGYRWCANPKTGAVEGKKYPPGDNTTLPCVNH